MVVKFIGDTWNAFCGFVGEFSDFLLNNLDLVAFFILAAIAIMGAIAVVTDKEVVHSAFYLALVFLCVGLFYFFLEAEFIGVIQILVYVGAITILFAFSIMLTRRYIMKQGEDSNE